MDPWFFAVDHLPTSALDLITGDGAFDAHAINSLLSSDGRIWLRAGLNHHVTKTVTPGTEFTVGVRAKRISDSTSSDFLFDFQNGSAASMLTVRVDGSTGRLQVRRGTTVLGTSDFVWSEDDIVYVELHVVLHDSTGEFELRVNGVVEASGSGLDTNDTASANCETIRFHGLFSGGSSGVGVLYTDFYIKGVPGAEGDFYGPILLVPIRPTSDVTQGWTRSAGADNFALVDEAQTDQGTTYVETAAAATNDLYGMGDLPEAYANILAVVAVTVGNAVDGGAPTVSHVLDDGVSAASVGAAKTLGTAQYRSQATVFMTAPDAGAWDAAKVDAIRLGIRSA